MPRMLPIMPNGLWEEMSRRRFMNRRVEQIIKLLPKHLYYLYSKVGNVKGKPKPRPKPEEFRPPTIPLKCKKNRDHEVSLDVRDNVYDVSQVRTFRIVKDSLNGWGYQYYVDYSGYMKYVISPFPKIYWLSNSLVLFPIFPCKVYWLPIFLVFSNPFFKNTLALFTLFFLNPFRTNTLAADQTCLDSSTFIYSTLAPNLTCFCQPLSA